MYFGIYSFYYTEIAKYKKFVRNQLILMLRNEENRTVMLDSDGLARLLLIDADNIGGECYTKEDYAVINPILDAFLAGERITYTLSREDVQMFLDLAMKRRLDIEQNERLAVKLAEYYNENQQNELLKIDMNIFHEVCKSIDQSKIK